MPLEIIREDISRLKTEGIVHSTNSNLIKGKGSSEAIFGIAGYELEQALSQIGFCAPGNAVITPGFKLDAKYLSLIHI